MTTTTMNGEHTGSEIASSFPKAEWEANSSGQSRPIREHEDEEMSETGLLVRRVLWDRLQTAVSTEEWESSVLDVPPSMIQ
jgi:hypothetical protein